MIPCDFVYCRPSTLQEAAEAYGQLEEEGKSPRYYAGGSEIITLCRAGTIAPGAVIDLKDIPQSKALWADGQGAHMGAACSLNDVKESGLFGALRLACGRIADHTNQCRITLGGNLCGSIRYRETSLPLLLCDAEVTLYGPGKERTVPFPGVFDRHMNLDPGEMVVQVHIPAWALQARHAHIKRTRNEKIDYPLVTIAALWQEDHLRVAFSGLCPFPFRGHEMEEVLNDRAASCAARADKAADLLPEQPMDDGKGSGEYRVFVLKNALQALLEEWEYGAV